MKNKLTFLLDIKKAALRSYSINKILHITFQEEEEIGIMPDTYPLEIKGYWSLLNDNPRLKANIIAKLKLICQNSLESFDYVINQDIDLLFVEEDQYFFSKKLDDNFYMYKGDNLDLYDILKQEILLKIPTYPKQHATEEDIL